MLYLPDLCDCATRSGSGVTWPRHPFYWCKWCLKLWGWKETASVLIT